MSYIVIAPDNEVVLRCSKRFFQQLSHAYEQCHLGKHVPYQAIPDGLIKMGKKVESAVNDKPTSDWFNKLGMCLSS